MTLQNINLNFKDTLYSALADDAVSLLVESQEIVDFKAFLEQTYSLVISQVICQITFDQNLSVPRLIIINEESDMTIVNVVDLNPDTTYSALIIEVTEQINNLNTPQ